MYMFLFYFDDIIRDISEDFEFEGIVLLSKEVEKEIIKIEFVIDFLSKSSLFEVEKEIEKEIFVLRDILSKRYLFDMDMDMEEIILV